MTLVTTSRKSTPESRSIAKSFAFAFGCRYIPRGKQGLREIPEQDFSFFIISEVQGDLRLDLYEGEKHIASRLMLSIWRGIRSEPIVRGVITSDANLFGLLKDKGEILYKETDERMLMFDGPQKIQFRLMVREV